MRGQRGMRPSGVQTARPCVSGISRSVFEGTAPRNMRTVNGQLLGKTQADNERAALEHGPAVLPTLTDIYTVYGT